MPLKSRILRIRVSGYVLVILLLLDSAAARCQDREETSFLCESEAVSLETPNGFPERAIVDHGVASGKDRQSFGSFVFRNDFELPVVAITANIEYVNSSGGVVFGIVYSMAMPRKGPDTEGPIHAEYSYVLHKPVARGSSIRVPGNSFVVVGECPRRARLTFMMLTFQDHSTKTWAVPGWSSHAVVKSFPLYLNLPTQINKPSSMVAKIVIDERGLVAQLISIETPNEGLASAFEMELRKWRFYPARKDGEPVKSEILALFRIQSQTTRLGVAVFDVHKEEIRFPLTVIDVAQTPDGRWVYSYGNRPGGYS